MSCVAFLVVTGLIAALIYSFIKKLNKEHPIPFLDPDPWWGPGTPSLDEDTSIRPFKIDVPKEDLEDLKARLDAPLRLTPPLEGANFTYGFSHTTLEKIVTYWKESYDWKKREDRLNQYPHFKTRIEGLDIHFLRASPQVKEGDRKVKVMPLLLVHGWPGSIVEFYNILPLLTTPQDGSDVVFDVICPSLPGFGFSEASAKQGLGQMQTAQIFLKLMKRIGFEKFYVQGGDWGALVVSIMATIYPQNILGVHLNMITGQNFKTHLKTLLGAHLPSGTIVPKDDEWKLFPVMPRFLKLLRESGYFHIQSTKPDTVGAGLDQTPVGLAAYILEKFSTWTHGDNPHLSDGGLLQKDFPIPLDQLLDNICVYWFTRSITSSMRYYAERIGQRQKQGKLDKIPCRVPAGLAAFPQELMINPRSFAEHKFLDIVTYTDHPKGGHFAAMERPHLLAQDFHRFVNTVESRKKYNW